jgi:hypothetical protein
VVEEPPLFLALPPESAHKDACPSVLSCAMVVKLG